jgi:hypothetical protein
MRASRVRARRSAPAGRGGRSTGLGRLISRRTHSGVLRSWTRAGAHRFPGDPSYAFALLHDPGRAGGPSPLVVPPTPPPASKNRRPQQKIISRLTQGFSIRCLRFKSGVAAAPARLASGWRAAPLPGGGRTLWTASKYRAAPSGPGAVSDARYRQVPIPNSRSRRREARAGAHRARSDRADAGLCGVSNFAFR